MKHTTTLILLTAALLPACSVLTDKSPPKTEREMEEEARRTHTVPDILRDPRPEMPPMGPLSMPMRRSRRRMCSRPEGPPDSA